MIHIKIQKRGGRRNINMKDHPWKAGLKSLPFQPGVKDSAVVKLLPKMKGFLPNPNLSRKRKPLTVFINADTARPRK